MHMQSVKTLIRLQTCKPYLSLHWSHKSCCGVCGALAHTYNESSKSKLSYPKNVKLNETAYHLNLISMLISKISSSIFTLSVAISMPVFKQSTLKYPLLTLIWCSVVQMSTY